MSVEKVNRYKAEREARNKELKKEKLEQMIAKIVVIVIAIALVVWIGFSVFQKISEKDAGTDGTTVNVNALDEYINSFEVIEADPGEE